MDNFKCDPSGESASKCCVAARLIGLVTKSLSPDCREPPGFQFDTDLTSFFEGFKIESLSECMTQKEWIVRQQSWTQHEEKSTILKMSRCLRGGHLAYQINLLRHEAHLRFRHEKRT